MKVNSLVFDFGNVITLAPDPLAFDAMAGVFSAAAPADFPAFPPGAIPGDPIGRAEILEAYSGPRVEYDRGSLSAQDYWALVGRKLGREAAPTDVERLRALDVACWFRFDEAMLSLLQRLRPRVRNLALLSNINEDGVAALRAKAPWLSLFDRLILSCERRIVKPEAEIYRLCVSSLGVAPDDCLFIDDLKANVDGARACGLNGHHYRSLPALEAELGSAYRLVA
jgi:putative hydrolase of the HAD superfamily